MTDQSVQVSPGGLSIPTVYEIPALGGTPNQPLGQPQPIAAQGGSIFNNGSVTLYFSSGPNPLDVNVISIAPGGTLPWPQGIPCWCWALAGSNTTGSCFVMPMQLPYSPGGLGGQPVTIVGATKSIATIAQSGAASAVLVAGIPGKTITLYSLSLSQEPSNNAVACYVTDGSTIYNPYCYPGNAFAINFGEVGLPAPVGAGLTFAQAGAGPVGGASVVYIQK